MCCDGWYDEPGPGDDITECEDCGCKLINGHPQDGCHYSPVICETCGHCPCDDSC